MPSSSPLSAFIIILAGLYDKGESNGIILTQNSLANHVVIGHLTLSLLPLSSSPLARSLVTIIMENPILNL